VLFAVYLLYLSRGLHLSATLIGLVFGLAGIGGLLAALLVAPITRRFGAGRAIVGGLVLASGGEILIAGATQPVLLAMAVLLTAEALVELGANLYAINAASIKAAITPDHLRGRVAATNELLSNGMATAGWLLGGVLGQTLGLRPTVVIAGLGTLLCLPWLILSPVRRLQGTGPEAWPPPVAEEVGEAVRPGAD
jgi:MFS family permease